jgi:single-strand DNA-binding protein
MNKSVNKVFLVGRLTRNPELRHTTTNKAMCAFGLATNKVRTTETGEKQEEADFPWIVACGSWPGTNWLRSATSI